MLKKAEACEICFSKPKMLSSILWAEAICYRKLGDLKTALPLAEKAVQLTSIATDNRYGAYGLCELAACEFALGMTDKALRHALESYEAFVNSSSNRGKVQGAQLLADIFKAKGDYRKALEYSELLHQHRQQVERQQSHRQMALGEFTRDNAAQTARREAEVKAQFDQQRNIRYALYAGLGVLALLAFLLYNRYRYKQRTNKQLEAARLRAEASEAFKSRFLANMSHEIRTPLHGIAGFTDLMLETALSEKQRRWLSSIHHSTERLAEVVNDILDLSKLEAGEVRLRQIPFSPARVAADVQEALSLRAENKGIELKLSVGEDIPKAVCGDPTRLYQVLMNLAGNAVKFTERGGVRIGISSVIESAGELSRLEFSVADTGIGIPPEKLSAVFDSFQQAGDDTTARFGGTGLGLTIAKELVQLQGSDIRVESEVGQGSVFSFVLAMPLANAEDLGINYAAGATLDFPQALRILLADDNALNREIAREAIRRHFENAVIEEAVDGKEAVWMLEQRDFDLVLMDMQMPEMTGTEAAQYIRSYFQGKKQDIPIIALTASATTEEVKNALQSGMNRHLAKPFKPQELAQAIAAVLQLSSTNAAPEFTPKTAPPAIEPDLGSAFDLTFLRDFCNGDEAQAQHFLRKFLKQCPLEIGQLERCFQKKDREGLFQSAHSFKPQLEFVGLTWAAHLAAVLEQGARNGQPFEELGDLLEELKVLVDWKNFRLI